MMLGLAFVLVLLAKTQGRWVYSACFESCVTLMLCYLFEFPTGTTSGIIM
jgi:hypothetical protein